MKACRGSRGIAPLILNLDRVALLTSPAALLPGRNSGAWVPEPGWTFWGREKSLAPIGIRTPDRRLCYTGSWMELLCNKHNYKLTNCVCVCIRRRSSHILFVYCPSSLLQIVSAPTQIFGGQFGLISANELGETRRFWSRA